jgi:hypothetical protein
VLEKWGRACIYCDTTNTPLAIGHIHPHSRARKPASTLAASPSEHPEASTFKPEIASFKASIIVTAPSSSALPVTPSLNPKNPM